MRRILAVVALATLCGCQTARSVVPVGLEPGALVPPRDPRLLTTHDSAVRGIALWASDGTLIFGMPGPVQTVGSDRVSWIPYSYFVVVGLALVVLVLTTKLVWGRWLVGFIGQDCCRFTHVELSRHHVGDQAGAVFADEGDFAVGAND